MKQLQHITIALFIALSFAACKGGGFTKLKPGIEYQIFKKGNGKETIKEGQYVKMHLIQSIGDTVLVSTYKQNDNQPVLNKIQKSPGNQAMDPYEIFTKMRAGDSAIIRMNLDSVLGKNPRPPFIKKTDKYFLLTVKITEILDKRQCDSMDAEQAKMMEEQQKAMMQQQMEQEKVMAKQKPIDDKKTADFVAKNYPTATKTASGMYYLVTSKGNGAKCEAGKEITMKYTGTPFGLKAMESLQTINPTPEKASNAQIMFLCLHASGLTIIPVSIIATRASQGSLSPTDIFLPCMIATFVATLASMLIVSFRQKINVLQPQILLFVLGASTLIGLLVAYLVRLNKESLDIVSKLLSNGLLAFIFFAIVLGGIYKKINVFDAFVEGGKHGFETCVKIIPYLVGMLVAISLLRNSGVFEGIVNGMKHLALLAHLDTRFVDGLPTALIKPLSGSGARGMMVDTMKTFGADSFAGHLSCILQGSSDTTFYVLAVYFGAVGIKNTRYSIGAMLLADLVGVITSILLCYLFFA